MCGFQNPAQPVQAAAGVALDGAQRHSGAVRDLGLGEVLVEGEAQYLPLVPGQAGRARFVSPNKPDSRRGRDALAPERARATAMPR